MKHDPNEPPDENRASAVGLVPATQNVPMSREAYGPVGDYSGQMHEGSDDFAIDLLEYLRIFNRRKWLILGIAAAFLTLGAIYTLMQTPLYTATVRLQIDRKVSKIVERGDISQIEGRGSEFLRTQYQLLQSRTMAERIASSLRFGKDTDFFKRRNISVFGWIKTWLKPAPAADAQSVDSAQLEKQATYIILQNRKVQPVKGSSLVDISYTDPVPRRAQRIANAYADAFIAANLDKRFQANAYAKTFLEDQVKQLKLRLEVSEKVLLDFAQKKQIVVVREKSSIAENNLAAANNALGTLISERIKNEQLWKQLQSSNAINLPQLLTNQVIDGLRGKRKVLETEYQEKLETFKPGYPSMIRIKNKMAEIDRQLAAEVNTIKSSFKAAYQSSLEQEVSMKERIETLRKEVLDLQKRSIQYNVLKREVDTNRSLYNGLLQRFKEVDIAGGVGANNIFIIDKAAIPGTPSSPQIMRALLLALMIGLGAGGGLAFLIEQFDDRILTSEDVDRMTGLRTLGVIPKVDTENSTVDEEFDEPRSALSEAYRSLCTSLQLTTDNGLPRTLLVTSSGPGEGKSTTSVAIARHFAILGMKVLLVDADLRNSSLHVKLGVDNSKGLSNYLTGGSTPPEAFQKTSISNLALMPSGPLPANPANLLNSPKFLSLISLGQEVFDLIVIDSPPVLGLADAPILSNATEATIFVVGAGEIRKGSVVGALKRLQLARSPIIGTVLVKFNAKNAGYGYGYGGDYGYGYDYGSYGRAADTDDGERQLLTDYKESA